MKLNENWYIEGLIKYNKSFSCYKNNFNVMHAIIIMAIISITLVPLDITLIILNIASFTFFMYRFLLTFIGFIKTKEDNSWKSLIFKDLPKYCILLPIRNERVSVVSLLIKNINNINYPKDKLDVILLIDEDDRFLDEIKRTLLLPSHFRIVSSKAEFPFTKPKVCNLGLSLTDAEFITIYDVEDNPDTNQLLKVYNKFSKNPDISCIQCSLNYTNEKDNWLTKFFTAEYLTWFNATIRGLDYSQKGNKFIPLGGTSQHLKVKELIEIGGWDAFNVTEDCDLGVRLSRLNKKTITLNSITKEKAIDSVRIWIKQRTRWQLGFIVTFFTHSKNPIRTVKDMGLYKYFHFLMTVFGSIVSSAITPVLFGLWIDSLFFNRYESSFIIIIQWITLIGNFMFIVLSHLICCIKYNKKQLILWSILQPFYYLLQSVTVYRAIYKYIKSPYTWEKTPHK